MPNRVVWSILLSIIICGSLITDQSTINGKEQISDARIATDNFHNDSIFSIPLHKKSNTNIISEMTAWDTMLTETGLEYLISQGYSGEGVKIGIIDNGVDFSNVVFENTTYSEKSFAVQGMESTETHGTGVMGMVVGIDNLSGTAKKASIISAEMGSDVSDTQIVGDFISAFEWLIYAQNVSIINTSWGGPEHIWDDILTLAEQENVIIVGSAGNDGAGNYVGGPGAHLSSISVGSITSDKQISDFSTLGPTLSSIMKPDLVTFGEEILTPSVGGGISYVSGTSYSSGFISGGIATLISALIAANISYTPSMIKAALLSSARDLGYDYLSQGAGLSNFTAAYLSIIASYTDSTVLIYSELFASDFYNDMPDKVTTIFPLTVSKMCKDDLEISMDGNLTNILEIKDGTCGTIMPITMHTLLGKYEGNIIISLNSVIRYSFGFSINIDMKLKGSILFDWFYNGDFQNMRATLRWSDSRVNQLRSSGYWLYGMRENIQSYNLSNYDLIWFSDPFKLGEDIVSMTPVELGIFSDYIEQGGGIFVSYSGTISSDRNLLDTYGTEMIVLNEFLAIFNMQGDDKVIFDDNIPSTLPSRNLINDSTYGRYSSQVQFFGQSIQGGHTILEGGGINILDNPGQGRVIVSSSVYVEWQEVFLDLTDWIVEKNRIIYGNSHIINSDSIEVDVFIEGDLDTPDITIWNREHLIYYGNLELISSGYYQIILTLNESLYNWEITSSNRYVKSSWGPKLLVDTTAPKLHIVKNASISSDISTDYIVIGIEETNSISDFDLLLNNSGEFLDLNLVDFSVSPDLVYIYIDYHMFSQYDETVVLIFSVEDEVGNSNSLILYIHMKTDNNEGSSSEMTTSMLSATSEQEGSDNSSFLEWGVVITIILLFVGVIIVVRRVKI